MDLSLHCFLLLVSMFSFHFLWYFIMEITVTKFGISHSKVSSGIEITDFQTPDKSFDTIKYAPDILKILWTSCIMVTFDVHKYSFCEINTYCVNKPCVILFYFFFIPSTAKSLIEHAQWRVPLKRRINLNTSK